MKTGPSRVYSFRGDEPTFPSVSFLFLNKISIFKCDCVDKHAHNHGRSLGEGGKVGCLGTQAGGAVPRGGQLWSLREEGEWWRIQGNCLALKYLETLCYIVFSMKESNIKHMAFLNCCFNFGFGNSSTLLLPLLFVFSGFPEGSKSYTGLEIERSRPLALLLSWECAACPVTSGCVCTCWPGTPGLSVFRGRRCLREA